MRVEEKMNMAQGHWVLAKLGKRVLRPGGLELTRWMVSQLAIQPTDDIVEFAPGLGLTAQLTLAKHPKSYTAVEINREVAKLFRERIAPREVRQVIADASQTGLPDGCADKVYGEAMLTMLPIGRKRAIVAEAFRILKPGGLYGIHEVGLYPDSLPDEVKHEVRRDLADAIQVNATPYTAQGWSEILTQQGFEIVGIENKPMHLLERRRLIADEGLPRVVVMFFRMLFNPKLRGRVMQMRRVFRKHLDHMDAISIIARKPVNN
ncbi:methyltransferase domain protein [Bacteroidales bacterium KA00251]|nr:methyltransferase domain protein [Bacteroidales bacterium KA00251]